jgi:Sulfatase
MSPTVDRWEAWAYSAGLALLYTSAFYLAHVGGPQAYWYPYISRQVLFPSLVGTLLLIPVAQACQSHYLRTRKWAITAQLPIIILTLMAIAGAFGAIGYSAPDLIIQFAGSGATIDSTRWSRIVIYCLVIAVIAGGVPAFGNHRVALIRFLSTLGYAYALLAILRMDLSSLPTTPQGADLRRPTTPHVSGPIAAPVRPRQVVWIIFDELDYNQTLGAAGNPGAPALPNLLTVSRLGVSATAAYSPARDTEVSLPSLLLATEPAGVRLHDALLLIHTYDGNYEPFDEAHSVFARLPGRARSGAVLGFYHPYCNVLPSVIPCIAMPMNNVGRWFDALIPFSQPVIGAARWLPGSPRFLPAAAFRLFEPMYHITELQQAEYDRFLRLQGSALVFLHINLPHAPGDYSQRAFRYPTAANDREAYRRNLPLVDNMIGTAMKVLREKAKTKDILMIISSDHWHRIDSPDRAQRIPWIAWHVDEGSSAPPLDQKISTVHTAELCLDFLYGALNSQQEIPAWWRGKSFHPPLMPAQYGN